MAEDRYSSRRPLFRARTIPAPGSCRSRPFVGTGQPSHATPPTSRGTPRVIARSGCRSVACLEMLQRILTFNFAVPSDPDLRPICLRLRNSRCQCKCHCVRRGAVVALRHHGHVGESCGGVVLRVRLDHRERPSVPTSHASANPHLQGSIGSNIT